MSGVPKRRARSVVLSQPRPEARLRLFCFPYAGGGASVYVHWHRHLPDSIEVCAIEYPGRGSRLSEPLRTRMDELVGELAEGLGPFLDRPFAFFGHSLGGSVSFGLARELRRAGRPLPQRMFISATRAPHVVSSRPSMHDQPRERLIGQLRNLSGAHPDVLANKELMDLMIPILRADLALADTHRWTHEEALPCPIWVLGGESDPLATRAELEPWCVETSAEFELTMFPGGHFFIDQARADVIAQLSRRL